MESKKLTSSEAVAEARKWAGEFGKKAARQMRVVDAWAAEQRLPKWDRQLLPRKRDLGNMLSNAITAPLTARMAARDALNILGREA